MCWVREYMGNLSVPFAQFCCESKTALNNYLLKLKNKIFNFTSK